jgi:uncharacterized protein (TIGR02246 family)
MKNVLFASLALAVVAACAQPATTPAAETAPAAAPALPTEAEVSANFDRWAAALATKDPAQVSALFSQTAVLQPTVSNDVRETPAEVQAYFVDFLKLSPKPTINERNIEVLDDNTAIDAGVWTFDLTRNGKPEFVTARYSFVWEKENGEWKIRLLHSSLMPEPVPARLAPLATP